MFDARNHTHGIAAIEKHMQVNHKASETLEGQRRLLRKWETQRSQLHANTKEPYELVSQKQLERIALLVDFAFSTHPFYNKLYKDAGYTRGDIVSWDDYHALPTVTKQDIAENHQMFCANLSPAIEECYTFTTSGSSGQVLTTMFDPAMNDYERLLYFRFYEQMLGRELLPSEWVYEIYLAAPTYTSLEGFFPIFTVSNDCPPEAVLEHMKLLKPPILCGFAAYFSELAALVKDPEEFSFLKAINTNSEPSTQAERQRISDQFGGVPVFDEYSSVELSFIATQCPIGKYHLWEDNVRVDVLDPDENGMGEIIATSLHNSFMPFIRYRQGDVIRIHDQHGDCECGNQFRYLEMFEGRKDQFLLSKVLGKVPPHQVMSLYDRTLLRTDTGIKEFQILQTEPHQVKLLIVPSDIETGVNESVIGDFSKGLREIFQDQSLNITMEKMDQFPVQASHKRRLIVCQVDPNSMDIWEP